MDGYGWQGWQVSNQVVSIYPCEELTFFELQQGWCVYDEVQEQGLVLEEVLAQVL